MGRYLGITRSSYYRWLKHPKSDNEIRNEQIADIIREIHQLHPDMGYRRIRDELAVNYGIPANDKRILRICRKIGIQSSMLWSSIFVTLMANKIGGLQFGIYRNCQISSRVFHTAVAALPLTKANRSDFE